MQLGTYNRMLHLSTVSHIQRVIIWYIIYVICHIQRFIWYTLYVIYNIKLLYCCLCNMLGCIAVAMFLASDEQLLLTGCQVGHRSYLHARFLQNPSAVTVQLFAKLTAVEDLVYSLFVRWLWIIRVHLWYAHHWLCMSQSIGHICSTCCCVYWKVFTWHVNKLNAGEGRPRLLPTQLA